MSARLEPGILEIVMGEEGKLSIADRARARRAGRDLARRRPRPARRASRSCAAPARASRPAATSRMIEEMTHDFAVRARVWREARDLVYNVINCSKIDRLGDARPGGRRGAGRRAARRHLDRGEERAHHRRPHAARRRGRRPRGDRLAAALRHGEGEVLPAALRDDHRRGGGAHRPRLARRATKPSCRRRRSRSRASSPPGAQTALRWTKYSLNNWLRMAGPAFDASLALECSASPGPRRRKASLRTARSASPFPPEPKDF